MEGEAKLSPVRNRKRRCEEGEDHSPNTLHQMLVLDREAADRGEVRPSQRRRTRSAGRNVFEGTSREMVVEWKIILRLIVSEMLHQWANYCIKA